MASSYASRTVIPEGYPQVLKDFTREVLRNFPAEEPADAQAWIYEFASRYFSDAAGSGGQSAEADFMSPAEMEAQIREIFVDADKDQNGYLDRNEFKSVVNAFCEKLDISAMDVRLLMAEVDADGDGRIAYHEFVPLAVDLLETLMAARKHDAAQEERKEEAAKKAEAFLFHGLSKEQLQATLRDMFEQADVDKSGQLSREEFEASLRHSSLGLTRREINALLMEADENHDGQISYEEFEPICVEVLLEMVASQFEHARLPAEEAQLRELLLQLAHKADPEDTGRLHLTHVQDMLVEADLGLTTVQMHALLAEASVDDDSTVEYTPFIDRASSILAAIMQVQTSAERAAELEQFRSSEQHTHIDGLSVDEWAQGLADRLVQLDTEGNGSAYTGDVAGLLSQEMGFDDGSVRAVLSYAVSMSDAGEGMVALQAVLDGAADIVLQRQEQEHLTAIQ